MEKRNTNGSIAPAVALCAATANASAWAWAASAACCNCSAAVRARSAASWGLSSAILALSLASAFRLKIRMHHGAIAGERGRLDDLVVPIHRQRLGLLVDENFHERVQVLGIKARCGCGQPTRVAAAEDLHAACLDE